MKTSIDECPGQRDGKVAIDFSELDNYETEVGRLVRHAMTGDESKTSAFPDASTQRIRNGIQKLEQRGVVAHDFAMDGRVAPFNRAGLARGVFVSLGLFSAFFLLPPWFAPAVIALGLFVGLASYIVLGGATITRMIQAWLARLEAEQPVQAREAQGWKIAAIKKLSAVIDRLPASWTQGLYLPDPTPDAAPHAKMAVDPFDRLKNMASDT